MCRGGPTQGWIAHSRAEEEEEEEEGLAASEAPFTHGRATASDCRLKAATAVYRYAVHGVGDGRTAAIVAGIRSECFEGLSVLHERPLNIFPLRLRHPHFRSGGGGGGRTDLHIARPSRWQAVAAAAAVGMWPPPPSASVRRGMPQKRNEMIESVFVTDLSPSTGIDARARQQLPLESPQMMENCREHD